MSAYQIGFDTRRGFLTCRVSAEVPEDEVELLCAELERGLTEARARGPIRLLWDHRGLRVLPDDSADKLLALANRYFHAGDRAAILVSTNLDKAQGRPKLSDEAAIFVSENAALTWLGIGIDQAA